MRNVHKPDQKNAKKDGFKKKKPLLERFKKGAVIALGALMVPAVIVAAGLSFRCQPAYKVDGKRTDSGIVDASVDSGDATQTDAGIDANIPDARPDVVELPDTGVDSSVDASVIPDSGVDGSVPTCTGVFNESQNSQSLPLNVSHGVGGYNVIYSSYIDSNNITVDVECAADSSSVLTGETFTRNVEKVVYLDAGDKNLRMTVIGMNPSNAVVNVSIETP